MRYNQDPGRTSEIVRLVLQKIREHDCGYSPTAYTLWYEHIAGVNPPLSAALEARLKSSAKLDQALIDELYAQHIESRNARLVGAMQDGLTLLLRRLGDVAAAAGDGAEDYTRSLEVCAAQLGSLSDASELQQVIATLTTSTQAAARASALLRQEVAASRSQLQELRGKLTHLEVAAFKDPLTGLLNRRGFDRALQDLQNGDATAYARCTLLTADIDHFKRVNDTYGHLLGDQVLCAVGKLLRTTLKGRDISARFGGEEFVVLLPETALAGAEAIAEQIRRNMAGVRIRKTKGSDYIDRVTLSIGIAAPLAGESLVQTLERADQALYAAKQSGRNCVRTAITRPAPAATAA